MIYLISFLFTLFFVYYTKHQLINPKSGKWHTKGFLMRGCFFLAFLFPSDIINIIGALLISAITFDIGINIIALKTAWYYVGKESYIDRTIGKKKWWIYGILLIIFLIYKLWLQQ